MIGLSGCLGTLLTDIQFAADHDSQITFKESALQHPSLHSVCIARVAPSQVQNLVFAFAKFLAVGDCSAL